MSPEELLEELEDALAQVAAPPLPTCPDIDAVIKQVSAIEQHVGHRPVSADAEELRFAVESELWGIIDRMEEIRKANGTLRDRGDSLDLLVRRAIEVLDELSTTQ